MQARATATNEGPWTEAPVRVQPRLANGDAAGTTVSPALLLQDGLAARLAELDATGEAVLPAVELWPVHARLAVIVGLSLACWAAIAIAAIQLF